MPEFSRRLDAADLMAYGAATWDWHRLHYDRDYAARRGLPAPVADGQMLGALCAQMLLRWLGPGAFVTRLSYRMRSMVFAGDSLRLEGEVEDVSLRAGAPSVRVAQRGYVESRLVVEAELEARLPDRGSVE